jgi:hypothetical protein
MIWAFLSTRIRTWVLFAVLLPLAGRVMQAVAPRVGQRNERAGDLLGKAGGYARDPRGKRRGQGRPGGTSDLPR